MSRHPLWRRLLLLPALPLLSLLCGFTPFTKVTNVCPKCKQPATDVVVLTNGFEIKGTVVAQNPDYYVVERHKEQRAVEKAEVSAVRWKSGAGPANLASGDQILLKNGVVLHGAITEETAGRLYMIQVRTLKHTVWVSQIKSVHKAGVAVTLDGR
jgi:hypothetical protein